VRPGPDRGPRGGWNETRAERVVAAAADAVDFHGDLVDFTAVALELDVACAQLAALSAQTQRLEARIVQPHAQRHPDDVLLSVPGIGPVIAGVVRAVVGDLSRFASLAALRAYTGLVPRQNSSGEVRKGGRISKAGPSVLRWALYLAADVARQWDPQLADLYRRLMVERGHTHTRRCARWQAISSGASGRWCARTVPTSGAISTATRSAGIGHAPCAGSRSSDAQQAAGPTGRRAGDATLEAAQGSSGPPGSW
jgi:hypothetical protein